MHPMTDRACNFALHARSIALKECDMTYPHVLETRVSSTLSIFGCSTSVAPLCLVFWGVKTLENRQSPRKQKSSCV